MPDVGHRHPLQGVINIVRFNAPTYAVAAVTVVVGVVVAALACHAGFAVVAVVATGAATAALVLGGGSLVGSYLTYDRSHLYDWACLDPLMGDDVKTIAHVHTGLDESTDVLRRRFPAATVQVFDASDPALQPEPSIARARRIIPLHPDTVCVGVSPLPVAPHSLQRIILPMAAHEVRDDAVRARWLRALVQSLAPDGRMVVVEHLRDLPNALAFHVGVLHFLSRRTWLQTFDAAGLDVTDERGINPFLRLFVLAPRTDAAAQMDSPA